MVKFTIFLSQVWHHCVMKRVKRHVATKERDSVGIPTRIARARNVRILISILQERLPSRNPYAQSARINLLTVKTLALYWMRIFRNLFSLETHSFRHLFVAVTTAYW